MEKSLQDVLTEQVGKQVAIYGRDDYVVVAVHSREAKIEAPKVGRSKPASTRYPKLRTLKAAVDAMTAPAEETESVVA